MCYRKEAPWHPYAELSRAQRSLYEKSLHMHGPLAIPYKIDELDNNMSVGGAAGERKKASFLESRHNMSVDIITLQVHNSYDYSQIKFRLKLYQKRLLLIQIVNHNDGYIHIYFLYYGIASFISSLLIFILRKKIKVVSLPFEINDIYMFFF